MSGRLFFLLLMWVETKHKTAYGVVGMTRRRQQQRMGKERMRACEIRRGTILRSRKGYKERGRRVRKGENQ